MTLLRSLTTGLVLVSLGACDTDPSPFGAGGALKSIDLTLTTPSYVFGVGYGVSLLAVVKDRAGKPRPEEAVTITPDPSTLASSIYATPQEASFQLDGSGTITFTACVDSQPSLCDEISLVIDDGKPVLSVDSPTPGQEIDDPDGVYVHGTAFDASPSLDVFVNGARVEIGADGAFATTLPPRFGVRHVDVLATDALTDVARFELDVMYAAAFTPATDVTGAPAFSLDDSVGIWLGQRFFDDGVAYDESAMPPVTHDVADVIELVVANADLAGLIPNPIVSSSAFSLSVSDATLGEPHVEMSVRDDGVDLFVRASALSLTTTGSLKVDTETFPLDGTITGSVVAYARLVISKPDAASEVHVTLEGLEIAIESVHGDFVNNEVEALFALASALLRSTIEGFVHDALAGVLSTSVPELLESVLSAIDHAIDGTELNLDQPPLPPVSLTLDGRLSRIDTTYRQHVLAPLSIAIASDVDNAHPGSRGVARLAIPPANTAFFDAGAAQIGVQLGFLNGVLHVLWASGLLDLDLAPLIPDVASVLVSEGRLIPHLAPILRPPRENETSDLVLSIGELEISLVAEEVTRHFGVSIEAGVDITVVNNVVTLAIAEMPTIYVWENAPPAQKPLVTADLVRSLLAMVWPQLRNALVSGLAISLPIPPLPLGGIAPDLNGFTLSIGETTTRLYPRGELLLLDVAFTGQVPSP